MADPTAIQDIKNAASGKFSEEEMDKFIRMGAIFASRTVLTALISVIKEGPKKGFSADESEKIISRLRALMQYDYTGYSEVEITGMDIKLRIMLSICPKNYHLEIDGPDDPEFIKDLYQQLGLVKKLGETWWKQFCSENPVIFERICQYRTDIDFTDLRSEPNNTFVMHWDADCEERVGVFCVYVDKNGNPFVKKHGKK